MTSRVVDHNFLNVVKRQSQNMLRAPCFAMPVQLSHELSLGKKAVNEDKPLIFIHGLFGSSATFKSYAQNSKI